MFDAIKKLSRRQVIRIVTFGVVLIFGFAVFGAVWRNRALEYKRKLDFGYEQSLENLATYVSGISEDLYKGQYTASDEQLVLLSAKLWKDASAAKTSLSQLPITDLELDGVYKFLSQVGDYSMALSSKLLREEEITAEEKANLQKLNEYGNNLNTQLLQMQTDVASGRLRLAEMEEDFNEGRENDPLPSITDGFKGAEEGFEGYPTLIYDGPFSDHLLEQEPLMLQNQQTVSQQQARQIAASCLGVDAASLVENGEEHSKMPSYGFSYGNHTISITQQGGFICYMLDAREPGSALLSADTAVEKAKQFLSDMGIESVKESYYEISGGICIINFAATTQAPSGQSITLYPDLIKVGVFLDDGQIASFDARGYLVNHHSRETHNPALTAEQAAEQVSENLTVLSSNLAIIPSAGNYERYCYEFLCESTDTAEGETPQKVLVYINADTGYEEQVLILLETPNGTLTV